MRHVERNVKGALALAVVVLFAGPALAQVDQIIHFTNGTTMPIRSHTVADGMIHVELDADSYLAFPISMVEKVTKAGEEIDLVHSKALRNQMAASHQSAEVVIEQRAESTSTEPEVLTREEKLARYTDRVRHGRTGPDQEELQPLVSTSAAGVRTVDSDGVAPVRSYTMGDHPNLSGRKLGYVPASPRKTVGGKIVDVRAMPNKSKVELVSKSRAVKSSAPTRKSGN